MTKVLLSLSLRTNSPAADFATSVRSTLPVIGVDLSPELLGTLTLDTAWVNDDDAWRPTHAAMPTSERSYADTVRRAVQEHAKRPGGNVWLYSVRDARVSWRLQMDQLTPGIPLAALQVARIHT